MKVEHSAAAPQDEMQPGSMDSLLAKLSEQQVLLAKQKTALPMKGDHESHAKEGSSASSTLLTPASESFSCANTAGAKDEDDKLRIEASEMARLKKELDDAKDQIARQKHELDQTRVIKHTFDQAMGPPSEIAISPRTDVTDPTNAFVTSNRLLGTGQGHWRNEDARSDGSDVAGQYNAIPNAWSGGSSRPSFNAAVQPESGWGQARPRTWGQRAIGNTLPPPVLVSQQPPMQQRNYSVPVSPVSGGAGRGMNDFGQYNQARGYGQMNARDNRNPPSYQRGSGWDIYTGGPGPMDDMSLGGMSPGSTYQSLGMYPSAYQPRPIGTPLSPTAAEFRAGQASANPWNSNVSHTRLKDSRDDY